MPNVKVVQNPQLKSNGKIQPATIAKPIKSPIKAAVPVAPKNPVNNKITPPEPAKSSMVEPAKNEEVKKSKETSITTDEVKETEVKEKFHLKDFFKKKIIDDAKTESKQIYALDQDGLENIIDSIATALSEKFVTKDEIQTLVEHTIQKMVVNNNVNNGEVKPSVKVKKVNHPVVPKKIK